MISKENVQKIRIIIGEKLAERRHALGLKMATVAQSTGISKTLISQIENGRYKSLKFDTLLVLSDYFQIPFHELIKIDN